MKIPKRHQGVVVVLSLAAVTFTIAGIVKLVF